MHPENVSPCHSMFSLGCRQMAKTHPIPSTPYLPARWMVFVEAKWEEPASSLLCLCKANESLHPDVGVKLHSWANSGCLLYSVACLKWHAGPKRRRPAEPWGAQVSRALITWSGSLKFNIPWVFTGFVDVILVWLISESKNNVKREQSKCKSRQKSQMV